MSKEKSQFENVTIPTAEGGAAKKNTTPALPANFSLGQNLAQEQPVSRAESVKSFLPTYQSQADMEAQEERKNKARIEKEGMNYDLYLLIKNKLAGEFKKNMSNFIVHSTISIYETLKNISLQQSIQENPKLYTPNPKDLEFIAKNLKEFFPDSKTDTQYRQFGTFLNVFIHAYFNSIPQEERKNLKLFLPGTKDLDCIGAELNFGELEVKEVGEYFGALAFGNAVLKAKKAKSSAGYKVKDNVCLMVDSAYGYFGAEASGNAILEAGSVNDYSGYKAKDNVQLTVDRAYGFFGKDASGSAILKAREVGFEAGKGIKENAQIIITEEYGSIGGPRKDNSQIILPNGQVLKAGQII
jgi:hypothetical protein